MGARTNTGFTIKKETVITGGFTYTTFKLRGWLDGRRIRKQFKSREEADSEKQRLEVKAANREQIVRAVNTRLTSAQVAEAEYAFAQLGGRSLSAAVAWYAENYRPPAASVALTTAGVAFLAERRHHVRPRQYRDYEAAVKLLNTAFPAKQVADPTTTDLQALLMARNPGKKRFNNLRGHLNAFFRYCAAAPRRWRADNPISAITKFKISRGIPQIISADTAARLMAYLETYRGGPRSAHPAGFLVPYFALALFAGLRPSVRDGELRRLADSKDIDRCVDLEVGVIRITPEISKVNEVRQIQIRPNLVEWLARYPLRKFPIMVPNMEDLTAGVRERFELSGDVTRHTFISMHVGRFRSLGDAALEAGNSEAMIKRHYLNLVSRAEALRFWKIRPIATTG